jgi:hypothetical protein
MLGLPVPIRGSAVCRLVEYAAWPPAWLIQAIESLPELEAPNID